MLPQITTNINTSTTILDIPSKTYKLNIDSEANAPYEIDSKNKVYFKIKKDDGYITASTASGSLFFNNTIFNNVRITTEFEVLDTLTNSGTNLLFLNSNGIGISLSIKKNYWECEYIPPFSLDDPNPQDPFSDITLYNTKFNYKYKVVVETKAVLNKTNVKVYVNDEVFFSNNLDTTGIVIENTSFSINYNHKRLYKYNVAILENEVEKYYSSNCIKAKPFYYNNKYGLLNTLQNNVSNSFKTLTNYGYGDTSGIIAGHLYSYPQSEDNEISFSIPDGHLIGESESIELLKKYYRLNHNIWFRTLAYSERTMGNVDGLKAVEQAVYKILITERYAYLIYSNDYGVELEQYIGKDFNYLQATIENTLREALTYDLRIKDVEVTDISKEEDRALVKFNVYSIYGDLQMEVGISV